MNASFFPRTWLRCIPNSSFVFPFLPSSPHLHIIFLIVPFGLKSKEQAFCWLLYPLLNFIKHRLRRKMLYPRRM